MSMFKMFGHKYLPLTNQHSLFQFHWYLLNGLPTSGHHFLFVYMN